MATVAARSPGETAVSSRQQAGVLSRPPLAPVAQWIERSPPEREVASSNLAGRIFQSGLPNSALMRNGRSGAALRGAELIHCSPTSSPNTAPACAARSWARRCDAGAAAGVADSLSDVSDARPQPIVRRTTAHWSRLLPWLVLVAWALLLAAWVMGNAPFAAPDEAEHYVRAVGLSEGHLIGTADRNAHIGVAPKQVAWTAQAARIVSVPRGLDPLPFSCELGPGEHSAACLKTVNPQPPAATLVTAVGNYQPLPYLLPAAVLRTASSAPPSLRLARAAEALTALALLMVAVFALYDAESAQLSLLGLLLAVTPMVLFCGASLSGSGTEIAAAVAFFSCLLRLARPDPVPRDGGPSQQSAGRRSLSAALPARLGWSSHWLSQSVGAARVRSLIAGEAAGHRASRVECSCSQWL